jgi:hypothetical protein
MNLDEPLAVRDWALARGIKGVAHEGEPWDQETHAVWVENFYTLVFSKPYIEGLTRWFIYPTRGGQALDSGLLDLNGASEGDIDSPLLGEIGESTMLRAPHGRSMGAALLRLLLSLPLVVVFTSPALADIPGILGGGNIDNARDPARAQAKLQALNAVGVGMCRIPVSPNDYHADGEPRPERLDGLVLLVHQHGLAPIFLFEYYTRWNGELGGREKWHSIGRAFAERFRPDSPWLASQGIRDWGVVFYSAINEPMWRANNPTPIPVDAYAAALEALADGVHAVDPALKVSPGGYQEVPLFMKKNPYVAAVAPLYNSGKLFALGIHRYWDVDYVPMQERYDYSLQTQFETVKREAGITADIAFYTDEINWKKRKVSEQEAAAGLLTALWDALGVVGDRGQCVSQFVFPWNLVHTADRDEHYGMCTQLEPWTPTARGEVVRLVCTLTQGMDRVACNPKDKGEFVLEGGGRKLWVWQNRKAWTDHPGTSHRLTGVPADASRLEVYAWDGLFKTIPLSGQDAITVDDLREGETWMFLAIGR